MANLTISIPEAVLRKARIRALEHRTSVNAVVRDYLERYAGVGPTAEALAGFLSLAEESHASSGPSGRTWTRDGLDDRTNVR
jgi:plasmid stability protein